MLRGIQIIQSINKDYGSKINTRDWIHMFQLFSILMFDKNNISSTFFILLIVLGLSMDQYRQCLASDFYLDSDLADEAGAGELPALQHRRVVLLVNPAQFDVR